MTADARQQAEQIVERVVGLATTHSIGAGGDGDVAAEYVGDVKRALAAAITTYEHYRNGSPHMEQVLDEQSEALSALGVEVDGPRPPVWEPDDDRVP